MKCPQSTLADLHANELYVYCGSGGGVGVWVGPGSRGADGLYITTRHINTDKKELHTDYLRC